MLRYWFSFLSMPPAIFGAGGALLVSMAGDGARRSLVRDLQRSAAFTPLHLTKRRRAGCFVRRSIMNSEVG
jgi:hypothetical protein